MPGPNYPSDERTHSFLIRLWQERPNEWRGTVRHVQSETQQGFVQLEQAFNFVRHYLAGRPRTAPEHRAFRLPAWFESLGRRRVALAWATMGIIGLVAILVILNNPIAGRPLVGTAGGEASMESLSLAFLAGLVLGGLAVGIWFRMKE